MKKITSALISVFYKDQLEPLAKTLHQLGVTIYSTGGTQSFLEKNNIPCIAVESLTQYPSILGGRVKTLHPMVFGGILAKREDAVHINEMETYKIPAIDLVIVDLYPFEETLKVTSDADLIIEKIDIGGPSMIRAAAKNFKDLTVIASKDDYSNLREILIQQDGCPSLEQRKSFAAKAFQIIMNYDIAINNYFNPENKTASTSAIKKALRYGENPHQQASFYGDLTELFTQVQGKEISYNNLVDIDAAFQLINEFEDTKEKIFAIIKHTNVCGIAARPTVIEAWNAALAGDPESAFGGILITNGELDEATAAAISEIFFEVLIAPSFSAAALSILSTKKNRVLLQINFSPLDYQKFNGGTSFKSLLNGTLAQELDTENYEIWEEVGGQESSATEKKDLIFANIVCKHLKSNAIALVKNKQLIGKGCGQTSRIDALRQAIEKAKQFNFDLNGSVLASDAFFPFGDCIQLAHQAGISAFIQPGGSIRDTETITYALKNSLPLIITKTRHFKH